MCFDFSSHSLLCREGLGEGSFASRMRLPQKEPSPSALPQREGERIVTAVGQLTINNSPQPGQTHQPLPRPAWRSVSTTAAHWRTFTSAYVSSDRHTASTASPRGRAGEESAIRLKKRLGMVVPLADRQRRPVFDRVRRWQRVRLTITDIDAVSGRGEAGGVEHVCPQGLALLNRRWCRWCGAATMSSLPSP